jgi:hypothetical protein
MNMIKSCSPKDFLDANGLAQFILPLAEAEVTTFEQLKACSDDFLAKMVGMKPLHVTKLQRAISSVKLDSPVPTVEKRLTTHAAENGGRKTYDLYEASDGFRGTFDEVSKYEAEMHKKKIADARK